MTQPHALTGAWQARCSTSYDGWLGIPRLAEGEREPWVMDKARELREDWAERWQPEHAGIVVEMLRAALEQRSEDDLLVFQVWPLKAPAMAIVRIGGLASADLPDWRQVGGSVQLIDTPHLGPGVQFTRTYDEGEGVRSGSADFVFDDGTDAVVVRIEPTVREMLDIVAPGIAGLLSSLEVERPDGSPFRGLPPVGLTAGVDVVSEEMQQRTEEQA